MSGQWWRAVAQSALEQSNFDPANDRGAHFHADHSEETGMSIFGLARNGAPRPTLLVENLPGALVRSAYRHRNPDRLAPGTPEVVDLFAPDLITHDRPADRPNGNALGEGQ